jgi:hypothetical protein
VAMLGDGDAPPLGIGRLTERLYQTRAIRHRVVVDWTSTVAWSNPEAKLCASVELGGTGTTSDRPALGTHVTRMAHNMVVFSTGDLDDEMIRECHCHIGSGPDRPMATTRG